MPSFGPTRLRVLSCADGSCPDGPTPCPWAEGIGWPSRGSSPRTAPSDRSRRRSRETVEPSSPSPLTLAIGAGSAGTGAAVNASGDVTVSTNAGRGSSGSKGSARSRGRDRAGQDVVRRLGPRGLRVDQRGESFNTDCALLTPMDTCSSSSRTTPAAAMFRALYEGSRCRRCPRPGGHVVGRHTGPGRSRCAKEPGGPPGYRQRHRAVEGATPLPQRPLHRPRSKTQIRPTPAASSDSTMIIGGHAEAIASCWPPPGNDDVGLVRASLSVRMGSGWGASG